MISSSPAGDCVRKQLGVPWSGAYPHPTLVMGIVNVTPNSFQRVGRHLDAEAAVAHGLSLAAEGADILDVGGESTRPGAPVVPADEEIDRVVPVIRGLVASTDIPVSVDTRKAEVAEAALQAGARIVNDVSAGLYDSRIFQIVAEAGAFICLMHSPLDTENMGWSTGAIETVGDISGDVARFLAERAQVAVREGVREDRIWVDPGFGFGKSVADNLRLLRDLEVLTAMPWPVLVGTSRKSTLGAVLGDVPPEERLEATLSTVALAIRSGAAIVRVHDVAPAVRTARAADAILYSGPPRT